MNRLIRSFAVLISLGLCAAGLIAIVGGSPRFPLSAPSSFADAGPQTGYEFASANVEQPDFSEVEEIVRTDAASRFPNSRIELGSVKAEHSGITMSVVLFGPNHATQAFLYRLEPKDHSWHIARTHRLWFVPASQIARGRRV
jgi:hypothetical protein